MSLFVKRFLSLSHITRNPKLCSLATRYHHCDVDSNSDPRTRDYFNDWRHKQSELLPSATTEFNPEDTATVFQSMSTYRLIKSNVMFGMLSMGPITSTMTNIMLSSLGYPPSSTPQITPQTTYNSLIDINKLPGIEAVYAIMSILRKILSKPLVYLVRKQYFPLLTGGENIDDCMKLAKKYYDKNIRLIIDNSTEESEDQETHERNLASKKEIVDVSHERMNKSVCFVSVKMTALASPTLLEEMTQILNIETPSDRDPEPFMSDAQKARLEETMTRLSDICGYAKSKGIGVWLDAEQYSRQAAMNYLSRRLMQQFNTEGDDKIYLYNTYQMYLHESRNWLQFDIEHAKQNGYQCGVKLVRGAYLTFETETAATEKRPNPIHRTKEDTDRAYDEAVQYVMKQIVDNYGSVGVAVCTHNRDSLQNAVDAMNEFGIDRDDAHVFTAQLNGMVDNLTHALGYSGYNALKLIPYGAFEDVWPFLMRRFEENSQILNGVQQERALYGIEIKRRLKGLIGR